MPNWAIVIGIERYAQNDLNLKSAAKDALDMSEWLHHPSGGNISAQNLFLLLSPNQQVQTPNGIVLKGEATRKNIIDTIDKDLSNRSGMVGDRLFFYYSGHGMTEQGRLSNVIIPQDVTTDDLTLSISIESILQYFKATQFKTQFFFFDSCRNIPPSPRKYEIGRMPWRDEINFDFPSVQQFTFFATSQGLPAIESQKLGDEGGAFTQTLLEGLRGKGAVKSWDGNRRKYYVYASRLFEHTKREVVKKMKESNDRRRLKQVPDRKIEGASYGVDSDPVIAVFEWNHFGTKVLEVEDIDPRDIAFKSELAVYRESNPEKKVTPPVTLPARFDLQPMSYIVRILTTDYEPDGGKWPVVDLFENEKIKLKLNKKAERAYGNLDFGHEEIVIEAYDPEISIELVNSAGTLLGIGRGSLSAKNLEPGLYVARLILPDTSIIEKSIQISPDVHPGSIFLDPPKPLQEPTEQALVREANLVIGDNNIVHVSEEAGDLVAPQLSTILALAGRAATYDKERWHAHRLRRIGISYAHTLHQGSGNLQVLFGIESNDKSPDPLVFTRIRLWPQNSPVPTSHHTPSALSGIDLTGQFNAVVPEGAYWLSLEKEGERPIVQSVKVMSKRITMLVYTWDAYDKIHVFQYMPPQASPVKDHDLHNPNELTPREETRYIRRLEMIERMYMTGPIEHLYEGGVELLDRSGHDPIGVCLAGYLEIKRTRLSSKESVENLGLVINKIQNRFADMTDVQIISAAYQEILKNDKAASGAYYAAAQNESSPIFGDGLKLLVHGSEKYGIPLSTRTSIHAAYHNQLEGLPWTLWSPPNFAPGYHI